MFRVSIEWSCDQTNDVSIHHKQPAVNMVSISVNVQIINSVCCLCRHLQMTSGETKKIDVVSKVIHHIDSIEFLIQMHYQTKHVNLQNVHG